MNFDAFQLQFDQYTVQGLLDLLSFSLLLLIKHLIMLLAEVLVSDQSLHIIHFLLN